MNPLGLALTFWFGLMVLLGSRKLAVWGLFATVCYLTQGQKVFIAGCSMTSLRLVLLAALLRILVRREMIRHLNSTDRILISLALLAGSISVIRQGASQALAYEVGCIYDVLLSYFIFRSLIRKLSEVQEILAGLAILIIPFALLMCLESLTGRNVFAMFGGVPADAWVRNGHVRSMASFRNPITAGTFGATLFPLFLVLLKAGCHRSTAKIGMVVSTVIVLMSRSSGPLMAYLVGILGIAFWPLRSQMRWVRRASMVTLIGLHCIMTSPVWFLIARVCDLTGGDGYHRAHLIDQFIRRFSSWWLMGVTETSDWMPTMMEFGGADITNQFILVGIKGGLASLILFVLILTKCFQNLGRMMESERLNEGSISREWLFWGLGAALFAHIVNILSVSYFDQMHVPWYFLLAVISAVAGDSITRQIDISEEAAECNEVEAGAPSACIN